MSEASPKIQTPAIRNELPAVCAIATSDNAESIARLIIRADRYGCDVLVAHRNDPTCEGVRFASHLGARIITPRQSDAGEESILDEVAATARALEYPRIIIHEEVDCRIDYERTSMKSEGDTYYIIPQTVSEECESDSVVVAIPAFNEEKTIGSVVEAANEYADSVLVIDDGSEDETSSRARSAGATVVVHQRNRGYGAALQTAFEEAADRGVETLVVIDADGQHDPRDIERLVDECKESDAEIVIASRFNEDGSTDAPFYRRAGITVVNLLTNLSMGAVRSRSRLSDTQSGFRAYDREAIESLAEAPGVSSGMSASTDTLYHAHTEGFDIEEIGTNVTYDVENASSRNPIFHGMTLMNNILRTVEQERPVTILGIPGFTSTLVGIAFGYWTVSNYISTGTFPYGLAITSAIFGLAGIFACFTAIILHSLNHHMK